MIQEYYKVLDLIAKERHPVAKVFQLDGLVRASLQAAAFGVLQAAVVLRNRNDEGDVAKLHQVLEDVLGAAEKQPSDTTYASVLERLEGYVVDRMTDDQRSEFVGSRSLAQEWIDARNRRAHGFVSQQSAVDDLETFGIPKARDLLKRIGPFIPARGNANPYVTVGDHQLPVDFCPPAGVFVRSEEGANAWTLHYVKLHPKEKLPLRVDVLHSAPMFRLAQEFDARLQRNGSLHYSLRSAPPSFVAREDDLRILKEWFESENRSVFVHGRGGLGKTALVLKFAARIVAESPGTPTDLRLIVFLTAKDSNWSIAGHRKELAIRDFLAILRKLHAQIRVAFGRPDQGSRRIEACATAADAIAEIERLTKELSLGPRAILLILDNAETIVFRDSDESSKLLARLARKVRLVITTRDTPGADLKQTWAFNEIHLRNLDTEPMVGLIKSLAKAMQVPDVVKLPRATLSVAAAAANGLPIVAVAIVTLCKFEGLGIEAAVRRLQSEQVQVDLGDFLYESAWQRLHEKTRECVFVIAQLDSGLALETQVLSICNQLAIYREDFYQLMRPVYFFAATEFGGWELDPPARAYVRGKFAELAEVKRGRLEEIASKVPKVVLGNVIRTDGDRIAYAIGAAYRAAELQSRGEPRAVVVPAYEVALRLNPENSYLLVRFAEYLMRSEDHAEDKRVLDLLNRAMNAAGDRADPKSEVHRARANLAVLRRRYPEALEHYSRAESSGLPSSDCALHRRDVLHAWLTFIRDEAIRRTEIKPTVQGQAQVVFDQLTRLGADMAPLRLAVLAMPLEEREHDQRVRLLEQLDEYDRQQGSPGSSDHGDEQRRPPGDRTEIEEAVQEFAARNIAQIGPGDLSVAAVDRLERAVRERRDSLEERYEIKTSNEVATGDVVGHDDTDNAVFEDSSQERST